MDPGLNASLSNWAFVFHQTCDVVGVSRGAGPKTNNSDPTSGPAPSLSAAVWHARSRRSLDHFQPCRMKSVWVSEARESTLHPQAYSSDEHCQTQCSVGMAASAEKKTKIGIGDRSDHRLVTDGLASDVQLRGRVSWSRMCAAPCTLWEMGPGVRP